MKMYVCMYICICIYIYIYIYIYIEHSKFAQALDLTFPGARASLHPVSITRFPLTRLSPGSGLLRNPFVHR